MYETRTFNESQINEYLAWVNEEVLPLEEVEGQCHICGALLDEVELPEGPERQLVCLKDREYFIESYDEFVENRNIS